MLVRFWNKYIIYIWNMLLFCVSVVAWKYLANTVDSPSFYNAIGRYRKFQSTMPGALPRCAELEASPAHDSTEHSTPEIEPTFWVLLRQMFCWPFYFVGRCSTIVTSFLILLTSFSNYVYLSGFLGHFIGLVWPVTWQTKSPLWIVKH